jgi:hypothetical protein
MYRCEICGQITKPGQPSFKVVTETRERSYPPPTVQSGGGSAGRARSRRPSTPSDGIGREIVIEKLVCADCAAEHATNDAAHQTPSVGGRPGI